jgi:hypothetical protein
MTQPLTGFAAPLLSQGQIGQVQVRMTEFGSLAVDQVKEAGDEMTRAGVRYHLIGTGAAGSGIAPVQTIPTTAAAWTIFNPATSGVTAYFDRLGMGNYSGTAGAGAALYIAILPAANTPATAIAANDANVFIVNGAASSKQTSKLFCASGKTLLLTVAGSWSPIARLNPADTILNQAIIDTGFTLNGRISIGPGCGLAMTVVSPTGTVPLFAPFGSWREVTTLQQ